VSWDEFVRKMTILILFDRVNSSDYAPKSWDPLTNMGASVMSKGLSRIERTHTRLFSIKPKKSIGDSTSPFTNQPLKLNPSRVIDTVFLMKNDMALENYVPYEYNEFGSSLYVISGNAGHKPTSHQQHRHMKSVEDYAKDGSRAHGQQHTKTVRTRKDAARSWCAYKMSTNGDFGLENKYTKSLEFV
jgi:hypothetical protein